MKKYISFKDLPESERPYEKIERSGAEALSDAELLAVVIRTGSREERADDLVCRVLNSSDTYRGLLSLYHLSLRQLTCIKGIGRVKACQLLCIAEIAKRINKAVKNENVLFSNPDEVASYFMEDMRHLEREQLRVVFLDTRDRLIKETVLFSGSVSSSIMEPREIFIEALKNNAVSIIALHNHPSGDPTPSNVDISSTKRFRDAGRLIGITVKDHIIIGDNRYFSFKEADLI